MSDWQAWLALVPAFGLGAGLVYFLHGKREPVRKRQRELRERLREPLREIIRGCDYYSGNAHFDSERNPPTYSPDKFRQIREDGLLSPCSAHLEYLEELLMELWSRSHVTLGEIAQMTDRDQALAMLEANRRNIEWVYRELDSRSNEYLAAIGRMDNNRLLTYLKYKHTVPRRKWRAFAE